MDNLVDIDALLGGLEMESGDSHPPAPSLHMPQPAASLPSANGFGHKMTNGAEPHTLGN